ncbi:PLC-like phosphodiesterase, partial [Rhizodiscina lignyota]
TGSVTYLSVSSTRTESTTGSGKSSNSSATGSISTSTSSSISLTLLSGGGTTANSTTLSSTSTSTSASPTNTQPCNGYPEFCARKYSNITEVCAHNSPFVKQGNAASNQELGVTTQLNDGIRMLQGQTHYENETLYFCHTSCDILNVGTVEDYLKEVTNWVAQHPYDVVTILLGNSDNVNVNNFTAPIQNSGLGRYVYEPPEVPMGLDDWPMLSEMIFTQKRVVFFLDYGANQTAVPYVLDEFSQMWETPFSPTNPAFPCTVDRPPKLSDEDAKARLYMANHNLNVAIDLSGAELLIPNTANLTQTNTAFGPISLGNMSARCRTDWGRPPNFLLVDYYNQPYNNGTVFQVAATMNNVTYNGRCCGTDSQSA